jgi:phosphoribosylanthranilate isomerase
MAGQVRIKICGIATAEDGCRASELGADAVGLNFYPGSARFVNQATAGAILHQLPPFVEAVAVFVNETLERAQDLARPLGRIGALQFHGEHPEPKESFPFCVIPAFAVHDRSGLEGIADYLVRCRAVTRFPAAILVDAPEPGQYGGSGRTVPWEVLADFRPGVPIILAGGLTPENVAEAVRLVRPYAVDVASGVESQPGRKDMEKVRCFIDRARAASAKWGAGPS